MQVDGRANTDAAWLYKEPKAAAANIANHVRGQTSVKPFGLIVVALLAFTCHFTGYGRANEAVNALMGIARVGQRR